MADDPSPTILPDLPIRAVLDALGARLAAAPNAVLVAPPGAGKTTVVPLFLLSAAWRGPHGRILLVEPRRLAARAASARMAALLGETVGETVGRRMRLDTKISARTRIEVVTEGVFTRLVLDDPGLDGIAAVLFDEFHERSLDADLGLALALDVQGALRPDLRIVAMSATLDGARVARLMSAEDGIVTSEGRAFPVAIHYVDRPGTEPVEEAVARIVRGALVDHPGSVLAFLPGQREIERTVRLLEGRVGPLVDVQPLYGALTQGQQDAAIRPAAPGRRKIVLSSSIAETSITIDGVSTVVDSGLARRPVFEPGSGLTRLRTVRASRASVDQRAGRAGRTGPGTAIRLWRAEQSAALEAFDPPEILASDLSGLLLDCAAWGVGDPRDLPFLDPPPEASLSEARALLQTLGAFDDSGRPTALGTAMRSLPLPPRLARMVAGAARGAARDRAADLAVLLTERGLGGDDPDLGTRLSGLRHGQRGAAAAGLARRLARAALPDGALDSSDPGTLLALAFPDRVAVRRGEPGAFVLANGRGAFLDGAARLAAEPLLVVADLAGTARNARILAAASLPREALDTVLAPMVTNEEALTYDAGSRSVRARRIVRIGKAVMSQTPLAKPDPERVRQTLIAGLKAAGAGTLDFGRETGQLRDRLRFLGRRLGGDWPDVSDEALTERIEEWLGPWLSGIDRLSALPSGDYRDALLSIVPADRRRRIDDLAPSHFTVPTGSRIPIRYDEDDAVLAVRVQELFGLNRHPAIADGAVKLTLELLSPAARPIQVTRDLPGFWSGSWREVRAALRGRYPRHPWPEDPATAPPTARAKPRG